MAIEFHGRQYDCLLASDLARNGMYLELQDMNDHETVAELFYSDQTRRMFLSTFRGDLPLELIEWLIQQGKVRLPAATAGNHK